MNKLLAIWQLFKKGHVVADPTAWKQKQITVTVLGGVIIAAIQVGNAFGLELPIDEETATAIAGGVIALINWVLTVTTTDKIGISSEQVQTESNAQDSELPGEPNKVQGGFGQETNLVTRQDFSD